MKRYFFGDMHFKENSDRVNWIEDGFEYQKMFNEIPFNSDDIIYFLGDIFDKTKHKGEVNRIVLEFFTSLSTRVRQIIIIIGNHEVSQYSGSNLEILKTVEHVVIVEDICMLREVGGKRVLCIPHRVEKDWDKVYDIVDDVPYDYVLSHTFQKENTMFGSYGIDSSKFKFDYTYFFSGHNHLFEKISEKNYCIGGLKPLDPSEQGYDFKYIILDENDNLTEVKIDINRFFHFKYVKYGEDTLSDVGDKEKLCFFVECQRSEKNKIEEEIYKEYKNVYTIDWKFLEEEKAEIKVYTDQEITKAFFKVKQYTKPVVDTFQKYYSEVGE